MLVKTSIPDKKVTMVVAVTVVEVRWMWCRPATSRHYVVPKQLTPTSTHGHSRTHWRMHAALLHTRTRAARH